jgi:hypothetical protein
MADRRVNTRVAVSDAGRVEVRIKVSSGEA